jgi:hypothetical protein
MAEILGADVVNYTHLIGRRKCAHVSFFNRVRESSSIVTRGGHASFRGQHLKMPGCHKHWSDGMGSLALGRAFRAHQTYAASAMPSSTWADEPAESGS